MAGPRFAQLADVRIWVPVVFGLAMAACTFDSSGQGFPLDDPASGVQADADVDLGGESDAGGAINPDVDADPGSGEGPAALDSSTALVRYFFDDAAFFDEPLSARDAIGNPELNLGLVDPDESTEFVTIDNHRGIAFEEQSNQARLSVAIQNSKVRDGLNDSKTGTMELVLDVDSVVSGGSRLSHIGDGIDAGVFTLRAPSTNRIDFYMNNVPIASWNIDLSSGGRLVLHLVVDTREDSSADRVRMYVNGQARSPFLPNVLPLRDDTIRIANSGGQHFVIGNREVGDRSLNGTFYYAALYSGAMSSDIVAHNAALLQGTDDSAQIVGQ